MSVALYHKPFPIHEESIEYKHGCIFLNIGPFSVLKKAGDTSWPAHPSTVVQFERRRVLVSQPVNHVTLYHPIVQT